ncbi:MAG TPA: cysteine rich repeat-containing protein [Steroidobacteraceae bacterium]|nr:cysteine rich repeat-containing protein [Steroidobacteraceae bacterium]
MKSSLMLLAWLGLLGALAQAQEKAPAQPPPAPSPREACQADMQKFCANVKPGHGRMRQCIIQHKDALSPACRDALLKATPRHRMPTKPVSPGASPTNT